MCIGFLAGMEILDFARDMAHQVRKKQIKMALQNIPVLAQIVYRIGQMVEAAQPPRDALQGVCDSLIRPVRCQPVLTDQIGENLLE
jgi:hypothetical protein